MKEYLRVCPDCSANPGQRHLKNCDVERCSVCGGQRLSCKCIGHDKDFAKWTGIWPGEAESKFLNIDLNEFQRRGYSDIFFVKKERSGNGLYSMAQGNTSKARMIT